MEQAPIADWNDDEPLMIRKGQWSDLWNAWQAAEARTAETSAALDEARNIISWCRDLARQAYSDDGYVHAYDLTRATLSNAETERMSQDPTWSPLRA